MYHDDFVNKTIKYRSFFCNFSTVKGFYRFCNFSQENLKANLPSSSFALRTRDGYDNNNVLNINANKTLSSVYGIEENWSLNCLQYYHVINGLPSDFAHDIFEGFATDFLQKLLSYFIQLKVLTPEIVNTTITSFNYSPIDQHNEPQVLKFIPNTTFDIKQTAREMWNLDYFLCYSENIFPLEMKFRIFVPSFVK